MRRIAARPAGVLWPCSTKPLIRRSVSSYRLRARPTNSPVESSSSAIDGTANVRKKASSSERVTSNGNSKQASR